MGVVVRSMVTKVSQHEGLLTKVRPLSLPDKQEGTYIEQRIPLVDCEDVIVQ